MVVDTVVEVATEVADMVGIVETVEIRVTEISTATQATLVKVFSEGTWETRIVKHSELQIKEDFLKCLVSLNQLLTNG